MSNLLLSGGIVLDPASKLQAPREVLIVGGTVEAIAPAGSFELPPQLEVIRTDGCWIVPGLIDVHVHLRDPGFPLKETIASGLRAAAAGGFTGVAAMANTEPVNDTPAITRYMLERAAEVGASSLYPVGAVSVGLRGRETCDYRALAEAGVRLFSDDGMPVDDQALLVRALNEVSALGLTLSLHEEERELSRAGAINQGAVARDLGVGGIPTAAESERVRRDLAIALGAGCPVHLAHVSSAATLDLIRAARARGAKVTCEVTPHHFSLSDQAVLKWGPDAKMNPPLRASAEVAAIRAAIADGTIDMIATDHAPHDRASKGGEVLAGCFHGVPQRLNSEQAAAFTAAANGVVGLETALGLALELVADGLISPLRLVEMMALSPARLLRLDDAGALFEGGPADLTVIDPGLRWQVRASEFRSLSRNTPFEGRQLKGRARMTIVGGKIVYQAVMPPGPEV
ncbi:MAG TPA: dihydroorotase [Candidatus Binataceae bacterium]|nr:dihydroorotase [Candidatus Binataceae bacterium]